MNRHGFSLIELLVVIGLISILFSIVTIGFNAWQRKSMVERYTKELYSDVQEARMRAAFTKRPQRIVFGTQQAVFWSYSSEADIAGTNVATKNFPMPFTLNSGWTPPNLIDFDTRGVMTASVPPVKVICITTTEDASYDAVLITPTITNMGKVTNRGSACGQNNVTQK